MAYQKPTFQTSPELRTYRDNEHAYWQDLGYDELKPRPTQGQPPFAPPPTREEIRQAIRTLALARVHSGWIDFGRPEDVRLTAQSWGVHEEELIDCVRDAGWGAAALRECYIMMYLDD
jgi:hypothetical protein